MIIKKLNQFKLVRILGKILKKLIFILGVISLIIILILSFYYFDSGMYDRYKPLLLLKKINDKIIYKYFGFDFYKIDKYFNQNIKSLKYLIADNDLENLSIKINRENLSNLERQRKNKLNNTSEITSNFSKAVLDYDENSYKIKMRVKGDRVLHWYNKNETSYKIDLRGKNRIWGLEEFSVQKPITRNYIYEYIFHKFLEFNNLISLKYFFVNLRINNNNHGIYAVEEGFSRELIERNNKKNGPIFGLDEDEGVIYPNIKYDLYSKNFWLKNNPELTQSALLKLNKLKFDKISVNEIFDIEKWAIYFAIIDLTGNFHGSIPKSVKLYYNPVSTKFEPIGFDGHYNSDLFQNFLTIDFLNEDNKNCDYICIEREWFLKFLELEDRSLNKKFLKIYINTLKKISSDDFINNFQNKNLDQINFFNDQFLSETSKKDKVLYKGLGPYIFDNDYLVKRSKYLQKRITEIENKFS